MRGDAIQRTEFTHWCQEKLRNVDTDQFRHVNNSVIATLFEAGRMEFFAQPAIQQQLAAAHPAVVQLHIDFHQEMFYPGEASIGTRVVRVGQRSVQFRQGIFTGKGCVASAEVVCVFLDPAAARAATIGEALKTQLLIRGDIACQ